MSKYTHLLLLCLGLPAVAAFAGTVPSTDDNGCFLVHDADELYGMVEWVDRNYQEDDYGNEVSAPFCIFIENDITVNEHVLASDGSLNEGEFLAWKSFPKFHGWIDGGGHVISGLYGDVGLVQGGSNIVIQNLGIVDSYFSGNFTASFVSNAGDGYVRLINVYSTATVNGNGSVAGGLVGYGQHNECNEVCAPPYLKAPAFFTEYTDSVGVVIENSYFAGRLTGVKSGSTGGLIGMTDGAMVKNSFFAGSSEADSTVAGIGNMVRNSCTSTSDLVSENSFYLDLFNVDEFKGTSASATELADGTILAKLQSSQDGSIWKQDIGKDEYPKLGGAQYGISYVLNGGSNDAANPSSYEPGDEFLLNPAMKEGDVFEGWYLDADFKNKIEQVGASSRSNYVLYAKWESGYSITYVNDNYSGNPTYRYADSSTFVLHNPTWNYRTFDGWFTDSTFTTQVTELATGNTEDIVLYAKWTGREIRIAYVLNGGTMGVLKNPESIMNGEKIVLNSPVRDGYIFEGWYADSTKRSYNRGVLEQNYTVEEPMDSVITLYATWAYEPVEPSKDEDGCYLVTNANELYYFNAHFNVIPDDVGDCIRIMNDIAVNSDLPEISGGFYNYESILWGMINNFSKGTKVFSGTIYGNGHAIIGLVMNYDASDDSFYGFATPSHGYDTLTIKELTLKNFYYENKYFLEESIPVELTPGNSCIVGTPGCYEEDPWSIKKAWPTPFIQGESPKYDAKGRSMKVHPNYGVFF